MRKDQIKYKSQGGVPSPQKYWAYAVFIVYTTAPPLNF